MDRATLLQIFQSRLERSDYSKLQKQGRTFYQEARRQASNTQARRIFVFFFVSRRGVLRCVPLFSFIECPLSVGVLWSCRGSGSCSRVLMIIQMRFFFVFILLLLLFFFPLSNRECLSLLFLFVRDVSSFACRLGCISPEFVN